MYKKKTPTQIFCGLHLFKELLNGKWKLMLIYYVYKEYRRPSQLQKIIPNSDRRVLDKQLNELVLHGFMRKQVFNTKVPKVEYELTDLGKSLIPVILNLEKWGEEHRPDLEIVLKADPKFIDIV
ncbi:transcriptional regulator, HxlR family [Chitinophaga sp. CF118]|uniref:winged helix-turn-helix transcriptional regulator n=1 Tax=Chitinophaga sp. CF118 TaxID=1884367 RepID=UPI0008E20239|nr:helix-turn-helix domain-containing protein [Chitinophaga sp. CF118]SFE08521.1 transcriptional regulator, HxlR family [Chitinophaga sp. CF118]